MLYLARPFAVGTVKEHYIGVANISLFYFVDLISTLFPIALVKCTVDSIKIRNFRMQLIFTQFWTKHYAKFSHLLKSENKFQEDAKKKEAFAWLEALLLKRHHAIHKKLKAPLNFNEIKFLSHIGKGSTSNVYLAKYRNNIVAVKEINVSAANKAQMIKFVAEMELMANLQHPNILKFEGLVMSSPRLCMVIEYAKAGSLRGVLLTNPFLDWR